MGWGKHVTFTMEVDGQVGLEHQAAIYGNLFATIGSLIVEKQSVYSKFVLYRLDYYVIFLFSYSNILIFHTFIFPIHLYL